MSFSITTPSPIIAAIGRKLPAKNAPVVIATFLSPARDVLNAVTILFQITVLADAVVTPTVTALKLSAKFLRVAPIAIPEVSALVRREVLKSITAAVAAPIT